MPKPALMIVGAAFGGALALAWWSMSQRGVIGVNGSPVYPAQTVPASVSTAQVSSTPFDFPPLPNLASTITINNGGGCNCTPSAGGTLPPAQLPLQQEADIAPAMPSIPNGLPDPRGPLQTNLFATNEIPPAIMGPSKGIQYGPVYPTRATSQAAPYTTVIVTAPRANTARGFRPKVAAALPNFAR